MYRITVGVIALLAGGMVSAESGQVDNPAAGGGAYKLEEIIVTAARREQVAFDSPYAVIVQSMHDLQETRQVRTMPDAMREVAGVSVQKTAYGQGSPYIRGFTGLRTLLMIDGIRLNNSVFREGPNQYWNTLDPITISRMEMVKGPSSVLYGSDAIGGAVNAITRGYGDVGSNGARVVLRGASAESSFVARPEVTLASGNLEFYGGLSFKDFGNIDGGSDVGEQPMTGYDERGGDAKLRVDLGDDRELIFAAQHVDQNDAWRTHRTIFGINWEGTTNGSEQKRALDQTRTLAYVQYRAADVGDSETDLTFSLSWHQQDEEQERIRSDGRSDIQGMDIGTLGLWGQFDMPSRFGQWTAGAELYRDSVDSYRTDFNADGSVRSVAIQGPVADDATYTSIAGFVQNTLSLSGDTELTTGIRYSWSEADAGRVADPISGTQTALKDDWSDLTGSIRMSSAIGDSGTKRLFGGISQGFRAPNLSDLTRFSAARSNEIETPVTELDPEQFLTYELGLKFAGERWQHQASVYYTDISDMIVRTPTGRIIDGENEVTKQNSGDGFAQGIELQSSVALSESWLAFGNFTYVDGEVDTFPTSEPVLARETFDKMQPTHLYAGARWQPEGRNYWLEGLLHVADEQDRLSTRDRSDTDRIPAAGTPGFSVFHLRSGWRMSDSLSLSFAVENIFDEDYRVHGSGVNEAGRNFIATIFWTM